MSRIVSAWVTLAVLLLFAFAQVLMQSNLLVVLAVFVSSCLVFPAILNPRKNGADILLLGLAFYLGFASLVFKTLSGQALDSNLVAPDKTSSALVLSAVSTLVGYGLSRAVFRGPGDVLQLGEFFRRDGAVKAAALWLALAACVLYFLHIYLNKGGGTEGAGDRGFGFFGSFYYLINVSLALLYFYASRSGKISAWLVIAALGAFLLYCTFIANEKRPIIDFGVVTLLSFIFIDRLRPKVWILVLGSVTVMPVLLMLAGALEATRQEGAKLTPSERAAVTWKLLEENGFDAGKIAQKNSKAAKVFDFVYKPNLSYYYPATSNLDRYSLIFPLDQIVRRDPKRIALSAAATEVYELIPGGLVTKTGISFTDQIAWQFGIRRFGSIARPVIGLPAAAYAVGGMVGVAIVPAICYFAFFSALHLLGGRLANSPMAIALAAILLIAVEWDFARLLVYFLRPVWFVIIPLLLIKMITARSRTYRRWRAAMRAATSMPG